MEKSTSIRTRRRAPGGQAAAKAVLALSASGYPLTQAAIRYGGMWGAGLTEAACLGLLARDAAMIGGGTPHRLRALPALLLWAELGASLAASVTCLPLLVQARSAERSVRSAGRLEAGRRAAVMTMFGLHTVRFWIYLRPDSGRREGSAGH